MNRLTFEQFRAQYPPMMGAEEPTPEELAATAAAAEAAAAAAEAERVAAETVSLPRSEVDALRRQVAEANKASRRAEAAVKAAEEARLAEEGKWKELAQQREQEKLASDAQIARLERQTRVAAIASRLRFRSSDDVLHSLTDEEASDDTLAEQALEKIAKARPYLVLGEQEKPEIGKVLDAAVKPPANGDGKPPLTWDDVQKMTPQECADNMERIQPVLAAGPPS